MPEYEKLQLLKETRSKNNTCDCYICVSSRFKGHIKINKGRGIVRNLSNKIDFSGGQQTTSKNKDKKAPKTSKTKSKSKNVLKLCKKCLKEIGRGKRHSCINVKENIEKVIEKLPEKKQDQAITSILRKKLRLRESTNNNAELVLSTKGSKTRIQLNPKAKRNVTFSAESLDNFQNNTSSSANEMKKLTNFLRSSVGKKSVPKNYTEHVSEKAKFLAHLYKKGVHKFECEENKMKEDRPVVWADAEELLEAVVKERAMIGNTIVKVMADGGQGFFKICMSILPENYSEIQNDDEENHGESIKQRNLYSEGGSIGKKGELTGVHRLIMLCIVPRIKETYENVQLLFNLIKLNNISFKFIADFKLILMVNGQQTATSTFPCPYCFVSLADLKNREESYHNPNDFISTNKSNKEGVDVGNCSTRLKTYGNLKKDYEKFCLEGKNKKHAKNCHSTINLPLFMEDDDVCVLQKCVIPELHILQGFVNHLFWNSLVPLVGREKALLWPKKLKLIPKSYHGEIFEGNACRKLLKEADKLLDPEIFENVGNLRMIPFITVFKAMNKVVQACFSTKRVDSDTDILINKLHVALEGVEVSETLKIHVLVTHIPQCLKFLGNTGLGLWSEQAGESIHREFLKFWDRYKINSLEDPTYASRLEKAVVEFSSRHI